jgi:hypothetical protein
MANSLYEMLNGRTAVQGPQNFAQTAAPVMQRQNPMARFAQMMQAMQNPAAFVRQQIPNLPQEIANNPVAILNYMQQNMGVTNQDIQQAQQMAQQIQVSGTVR